MNPHVSVITLGVRDLPRAKQFYGEGLGWPIEQDYPVWVSFKMGEGSSTVGLYPWEALAADPDVARWNGHSLSSGQLAKIYGFTDLDGSQPEAWRYMTEVQEAGKPSDVTGYR